MTAVDDVYMRDASNIFKAFSDELKNADFAKLEPEAQLKIYQQRHGEFAKTFPIVIRYMIQFRQYKPKAMRRFLKKLHDSPYRSEAEYCERQADYAKYLYMESVPHYSAKVAGEVYADVRQSLLDELKAYKEMLEKIKKKTEEGELKNAEERRRELKDLLGAAN
jgi:hypothetical protein